MIRISKSQLEEGSILFNSIFNCNYFVDCLFGEILVDDFEEDSEREKCKLFQFRKRFELDSPVLYERFRELSDYDGTINAFEKAKKRGSSKTKRIARRKLQDLYLFAQISIFDLYPLYLAGGMTVSFLSPKEINKIERKLAFSSNKRIGKEFRIINNEWFNLILTMSTNFNDYRTYVSAIIQITYLFIEGLKNSFPCIPTMDRREKEILFRNIENTLNKRKRG